MVCLAWKGARNQIWSSSGSPWAKAHRRSALEAVRFWQGGRRGRQCAQRRCRGPRLASAIDPARGGGFENAFVGLTQTEARAQELQDEVVALTHDATCRSNSYEAGVR